MKNLEFPKFISGISTDKKDIEQRRLKLTHEYKLLLAKLMNKKGSKVIYNEYLKVDVHLVMREGGKGLTSKTLSLRWKIKSEVKFLLLLY